MTAEYRFEQLLAASWPADRWKSWHLLVGVSGGADSVALVTALAALAGEARPKLAIGHFNHGLRGAESLADQEFVERLADRLSVAYYVGQPAQPLAEGAGDGLEAAARTARYQFLQATAERLGARYVVVAHTADDQAETVLHHVLRGTGLAGLAGIARTRCLGPAVTLIRPLLEVSRADVLTYLAEIGQEFREDSSNADTQFTRNRLRRDLLPMLERDYGPGVRESLRRLGTLAGDAQGVIQKLAEQLLETSLVGQSETRATLDCHKLAGADQHLVREAFVALWRQQAWPLGAMGYVQWQILADMALEEAARQSRHTLPGTVSARRDGNLLELSRPA